MTPDPLQERVARALRDCDEMQYPQMLTDDFIDSLAAAVLADLREAGELRRHASLVEGEQG